VTDDPFDATAWTSPITGTSSAINAKSPQAQRMLQYSFNLIDDGLVGQQLFAGEATRWADMTDEAVEGRDAFLEKRDTDWSAFPRYF
jgi:naphthoate synthase